jgi:TatD DNase family protein
MLIDSHCHLHSLDLSDLGGDMRQVLAQAQKAGVKRLLSVCIELDDFPTLCDLAQTYPDMVNISVGLHPNCEVSGELTAQMIADLAKHPACIAIGETGLDYYRTETEAAKELQRSYFREHIRAALMAAKPLIIHTRQAADDTLSLLIEEKAEQIGGVMHCFSESIDIARRAMDLGFYISFSGIITFKNATALQEVAKFVPLDRILIETDSPYLAPVPYRGKQNHPALVHYVAKTLADLRGVAYEEIATMTTRNFYHCFRLPLAGEA